MSSPEQVYNLREKIFVKYWLSLLPRNQGSQEIPVVTGKFGLEEQNKVGQRLTEFCLENALVIANTHFQQHKRQLDIKCNRVLFILSN